MKGQHTKIIFRVILLVGFLALAGGLGWFLLRPAQVTVAEVSVRELAPSIQGVGTVESKTVVMVASKISGKVISINVDQGDNVLFGQVLATLEDSESLAEIEKAEANLQRSRSTAEVRRAEIQRSLSGIEIQRAALQRTIANVEVQRTSLQRAIANVEVQRAALRRAKSALAGTETAISKARALQEQARINSNRWYVLYQHGDVSKMEMEERLTMAKTADEDLKNAIALRNTAIEDVRSVEAVIKTSGEDVRNVEAQIRSSGEDVKQAQAQLKAANDDAETLRTGLKVIEQDIAAAEAAVSSANARKADGVIISQITGYVVSRELEPGAVVNPGTPILKVADPTTIWATVYIDEIYARSFETGDAAEITLRSMPTSDLKGNVARIRRESDRVTEQIAVDISFDKTPENLHLGEQLEVVIKPKSRTAKAIPASALISAKDGFGVWLVEEGRLRFRKIQTGMVDASGWAEVVSGLEDGEKVVAAPGKLSDLSNEGRRVSIVAGEQTPKL